MGQTCKDLSGTLNCTKTFLPPKQKKTRVAGGKGLDLSAYEGEVGNLIKGRGEGGGNGNKDWGKVPSLRDCNFEAPSGDSVG